MRPEPKEGAILIREHVVEIIDGKKEVRQDFIEALHTFKKEITENWPEELRDFIINRLVELNELPNDYKT